MRSLAIQIDGMTCEHCTHSVRQALEKLPGVSVRDVNLSNHVAIVNLQDQAPPMSALAEAIRNSGYTMAGFRAVPDSAGAA